MFGDPTGGEPTCALMRKPKDRFKVTQANLLKVVGKGKGSNQINFLPRRGIVFLLELGSVLVRLQLVGLPVL